MSAIPSSPPPPPPPPPPGFGSVIGVASQPEPPVNPQDLEACRHALAAATKRLEQARCKESDLEASLVFGSSLLRHKDETTINLTDDAPGGIRDAWNAVAETTKPDKEPQPLSLLTTSSHASEPIHLGSGQYAKAVVRGCIQKTLKRSADIASSIQADRLAEGPLLEASVKAAKSCTSTVWLQILDERLQDILTYHAKHNAAASIPIHKRQRRVGNPAVDGYDLACTVVEPPLNYAEPEVMGKYLALEPMYEEALDSLKDLFVVMAAEDESASKSSSSSSFLYPDFLIKVCKLPALAEATKLKHRKKYSRFLVQLKTYLQDFLQRTVPLFHLETCIEPAVKAFEATWKETGGCQGWESKPAEAIMVVDATGDDDDDKKEEDAKALVDLSQYKSAQELADKVNGDVLKAELSRLGLKCGGTPLDRAKRLFLLKDTPLEQLPAKLFVKKPSAESDETTAAASGVGIPDRRVDIARQEAIVGALLDQLTPTIEATIRRAERRMTQTLEEQDKEVDEELFGTETGDAAKKARNNGDSDDESDDGPIYNPKNVPLDFDGKPIPYWLFKLHGLNHYYPCEICGGETYRGRRNFELHFADSKHTLGMRSLGIPNTKHFHGVTTIQDAQELWATLQEKLQQEQFDNLREEEYEDSNGNVLSRATYEDLARQGLL